MVSKEIAILGAGQVGAALGEGWARAGHHIRFGVPNPNDPKHRPAAERAGNARVASPRDSAEGADFVVLAVPWDAVGKVIADCGGLAGHTVLDATNPLKFGPNGLELAIGFTTSGGEEVARLAPAATVFKTMNQVGFQVMANTQGYPTRPVMFVAGNDATKKTSVLALVGDLGFEAIDAGPLDRARLLESLAMLWIDQAVARGAPRDNAFAFMHKAPAET